MSTALRDRKRAGKTRRRGWRYPYTPNPKQAEAHAYKHVDELLYGGAAGGGKSEWALAEAVYTCLMLHNAKVLFLRRTLPELETEIIPRLLARVPEPIGVWRDKDHTMTFHTGSMLRFGYLENYNDRFRYLGAEYVLIVVDELTTLDWDAVQFVGSRLRAAGALRQEMDAKGLRPRMIATSNPGGRSHSQVKGYYVDAGAPGKIVTDEESGTTRVYIHARLDDTPQLDGSGYKQRLMKLPEDTRRAYLDGDWDILAGNRFKTWSRDIHVIPARKLPWPGTVRCVGVDFGTGDPFAAVWLAKFESGLIVAYRDYQEPDLTAAQQAEKIIELETDDERTDAHALPVALDPAAWRRGHEQPGFKTAENKELPPKGSIAWYFRRVFGLQLVKAYNARKDGWALLDELLRVPAPPAPAIPRLVVMDNCTNLIRAIGAAPRDKRDPEDVDTTWHDDHILDALRYGLQEIERHSYRRSDPNDHDRRFDDVDTVAREVADIDMSRIDF